MPQQNTELSFRVGKLDLLIGLMATHLVQDAINPTFISVTKEPVMYSVVVGSLTVTITLLTALSGFAVGRRRR
jgi:hypothetical protein